MKKRIMVLLVIVFLFIQVVQSFSSSGRLLTKEEAADVMTMAVLLRRNIFNHFTLYESYNEYGEPSGQSPQNIPKEYNKYKPVAEGYDSKGIKEKIYSTFTDSIADEIVRSSKEFFDAYYYENDVCYFGFYPGGGDTPHKGEDYTRVRITEENINNLEIVSNENGKARILVPIFRQNDYYFRLEVDGEVLSREEYFEQCRQDSYIYVDLIFDDNCWKISGLDNSNMIFRANSAVTNNELNEEYIREAVIATVYDIYCLSRANMITGRIDTIHHESSIYKGKNVYLEGNLRYKSTWNKYLSYFCTNEIADRVFKGNASLMIDSNGLISTKVLDTHFDLTNNDTTFPLAYSKYDKVNITSLSDNNAYVTYVFKYLYSPWSGGATLTEDYSVNIEFIKIDNEWKISGGDFIEKLDRYYEEVIYKGPIPLTSDDISPLIFALIVVLTLVSAILRKKLFN